MGELLAFVGSQLRLAAIGRWHRFGYACVNFGTPVSATEYLGERGVELARLTPDERRAVVERLGHDLMHAVGDVVPVLPVALVASALAEDPGRSWSSLELKARAFELTQALARAGAHVYVPRHDQDYAIEVGLRMLVLRRFVEQSDGLYRPVPSELRVLRYYANSIAHLLPAPAQPRQEMGKLAVAIAPTPA